MDKVEDTFFMGKRIGDMDRAEMLRVIEWALRAEKAARAEASRDLRSLARVA